MYGSIDASIEKLMRQLRRFRDKVRDHHSDEVRRGRALSLQILRPERDEDEEIKEQPAIVRQESIVAREMNVDDALVQMDLLSSDFLVFTDSNSRELNVMYRMPDGHFGLIEATRVS
jgi:putative sigma-54 modulation protein